MPWEPGSSADHGNAFQWAARLLESHGWSYPSPNLIRSSQESEEEEGQHSPLFDPDHTQTVHSSVPLTLLYGLAQQGWVA